MELERERIVEKERVVSKEEQEHNEKINERYLKLMNTVDGQFKDSATASSAVQASVFTPNATTYAPTSGYASVMEQTPQVTEYASQRNDALFSTEAYTRMGIATEQEIATVYQNEITTDTVHAAEETMAVKEGYGLNTAAKLVVAAFATVVVALTALICVNTHTLEQKGVRIRELQTQKQSLIELNAEVERRIADAKSEETIREYAESQGMVQIG